MTVPSYLMPVFVVTAGQNADNLGIDESEIVFLAYMLYDVSKNKVIAVEHSYVRPTRQFSKSENISQNAIPANGSPLPASVTTNSSSAMAEDGTDGTGDCSSTSSMNSDDNSKQQQPKQALAYLTSECRQETGIDEQLICNAPTLDAAIREMVEFVAKRLPNVNGSDGTSQLSLVSDGSLHVRMALHSECCQKDIGLPKWAFRYIDIREEMQKQYKSAQITSLADAIKLPGIQQDFPTDYGTKHVYQMGAILSKLITDGHKFSEPERVAQELEPGICFPDEMVSDDCIVRVRGLPWQCSDHEIARFFRGLNISKGGVALCLSAQGRRNGEALIRFVSRQHRELAMRKHKHHLGQRYIEVYRDTGKNFIAVAAGTSADAQAFLSRPGNVIIRMRGLPYTCTAAQIVQFFQQNDETSVEILDGEKGVLFVKHPDGRATGDAFVMLKSEEEGALALTRHRQVIGTRYIELFKSTAAEVQQVLNRSLEGTLQAAQQQAEQAAAAAAAAAAASIPQPLSPHLLAQLGVMQFLPSTLFGNGSARDMIRLRCLPAETTVNDILQFLGNEHSKKIVYQGVHLVYLPNGIPSGEAYIRMCSEAAAEQAAHGRHRKQIVAGGKRRIIDVIVCSGDEMNLILATGSVSPTHQQTLNHAAFHSAFATPPSTPLSAGFHAAMQQQHQHQQSQNSAAVAAASLLLQQHQHQQHQQHQQQQQQQQHQQQKAFSAMTGVNFADPMAQFMQPATTITLLTSPPSMLPAGASLVPLSSMSSGAPHMTITTTAASSPTLSSNGNVLLPPTTMATRPLSLQYQSLGYYYPASTCAGATPNSTVAVSPLTMAPAFTPSNGHHQLSQAMFASPLSAYLTACTFAPQQQQQGLASAASAQATTEPAAVIIRGLPATATPHDVARMFEGLIDMPTEAVRINVTADGQPTGDAVIMFANLSEAERAVAERGRKPLAPTLMNSGSQINKQVEMFVARIPVT